MDGAEPCRAMGDSCPRYVSRSLFQLAGSKLTAAVYNVAHIPWPEAKHHGVTGDDLADHTTHAAGLGDEVPLNLAFFQGA